MVTSILTKCALILSVPRGSCVEFDAGGIGVFDANVIGEVEDFAVDLMQRSVGLNVDEAGDVVAELAEASSKLGQAEVRADMAAKQGMNANSQVPREALDLFTDTSSWYWTYALAPTNNTAEWGNANGKEFVGLFNLKKILPPEYGSCSFREPPFCRVDQLVQVLEDTKKKVNGRMEYVMGFNEPYESHWSTEANLDDAKAGYGGKDLKEVSGALAAEWWRNWVQPAAQQADLKLVSPTTGISQQKAGWMVEFLQACYALRDASPPCSVELIERYSVHEYKCHSVFWHKYAALEGTEDVNLRRDKACGIKNQWRAPKETNIYDALRDAMNETYTKKEMDEFWNPYFRKVKLWVTEVSCSGDLDWNTKSKYNWNDKNKPKTPSAEDSCKSITGQSCIHEEGVVKAMLDIDTIERFSWFTLWPTPKEDHPNRESIMAAGIMDAETGEPLPVGRALLAGLDPIEANCDDASE